jgi:hypothetical protein
MSTLTIQLPLQRARTDFNLRRWAELLADPEMAKIEARVETDRHGRVIMSPPPSPSHGSYQLQIGALLDQLLPGGRTLTECPFSTESGGMLFFGSGKSRRLNQSRVCPRFPSQIRLRVF